MLPLLRADCPFGGRSCSSCIADLLPDVELPSTDLEDDAAADTDDAAWPNLQLTTGASLSAAQSSSASGSGGWDAADSSAGQDMAAQQQELQHTDANMSFSPARPVAGASDAVVGLKSPESLPW
jgi:hypothetical protein